MKLGGEVEALTFSGGIGEKSEQLRKAVVEQLGWLGFGLDQQENRRILQKDGTVLEIGNRGTKKVLVVRTDEQASCLFREMGRMLMRILV